MINKANSHPEETIALQIMLRGVDIYILGWCELFGNVTLAFELRKHVHQILYLETRFLTLL
jgi:hypothetical protein